MATGDLAVFQAAAVVQAARVKLLASEAKQLRSYWDKLDLSGSSEQGIAPLTKANLADYANFLAAIADLMGGQPVSQGDWQAIVERIATDAVVNGY